MEVTRQTIGKCLIHLFNTMGFDAHAASVRDDHHQCFMVRVTFTRPTSLPTPNSDKLRQLQNHINAALFNQAIEHPAVYHFDGYSFSLHEASLPSGNNFVDKAHAMLAVTLEDISAKPVGEIKISRDPKWR